MLDAATTPNSPDWWLLRLGKQLSCDRPRYKTLEEYWRGEHPLPFGNRKMRETYRRFQEQARTNFVKLVAESVVERLNITGFRVGGADNADEDAWSWWLANDMNANSSLVHRAAITMSKGYVIVGAGADGKPLVTGEDPRQVIHESSPLNRRDVLAAMKCYRDEIAGKQLAVVYMPTAVYYYQTVDGGKNYAKNQWNAEKWEPDTSVFENGVGPNPLGEVPVVPFFNMPDLAGHCLGEFEDVCPIQDRLNTEILDRLVISAMQAYRQRYGTGMDPTDEKGNAQNAFDPGADLLWIVPDDKAKFGEFEAIDLRPILAAVDADVTHLAAITRTPPSYMLGSIVNSSGDALAAAEVGLVSKVIERSHEYGRSWEIVHRLADKVMGRAPATDVEIMWRDPQFRTVIEMAAAAVQMMTAGVPWHTRMAMMNFSPGEIARMEIERAVDSHLNPNPDITIPGSPSPASFQGPSSALAPPKPGTPGAPGGAAQPAASLARANSPDPTGAPP